jgi:UDP-N-acetylmuramyl pentapeptide phosphotransferase/UDP-N-acetylglucosamine-1-phosphate transferase
MGDVGSLTLGFLIATLPFQAPITAREDWIFTVALILWFFLADGAFTLARRVIRHERIWTPHRSHLYQRLVLAGLRHNHVVWIMVAGAVPITCLAIIALQQRSAPLQWIAIGLGVALVVAFRHVTLLAERVQARQVT